jgi:hypothetical protein
MQAGVEAFEAAGYFGLNVGTLFEVYGYHSSVVSGEGTARATGRRA